MAALSFRKPEKQTHWGGNDSTFSAFTILQDIPVSIWKTMLPLACVVGASLIIFAAVAVYLSVTDRRAARRHDDRGSDDTHGIGND